MNDMSYQAGLGRSYKYLLPSVVPLYEFGAGLPLGTSFGLAVSAGLESSLLALSMVAVQACVDVTNTGARESPVVVTVFAQTTHAELEAGPALLPNRRLIAFDKQHVNPGQRVSMCFPITDEDLALVDGAGSHVSYAGNYSLIFFDGINEVSRPATVQSTRVIATLPPVNNPQPPCCEGEQTTCCWQ
jgi:hypothetical protein